MINKPYNLFGADNSKAYLSLRHLSLSSTKVNLENLYWAYSKREPDLRGNVIGANADLIKKMMQRLQSSIPATKPLTGRRFMEQQYREGKLLNLPKRQPLTEEEKAERARLAQVFAGGKPMSEMVIEDRGPR